MLDDAVEAANNHVLSTLTFSPLFQDMSALQPLGQVNDSNCLWRGRVCHLRLKQCTGRDTPLDGAN